MKIQEIQNERDKMLLMLQGLGQIGRAAASALTDENILSENTTTMEKGKPDNVNVDTEIVTLNCPKCNSDITFPSDTTRVTCPNCGETYNVKKTEEK